MEILVLAAHGSGGQADHTRPLLLSADPAAGFNRVSPQAYKVRLSLHFGLFMQNRIAFVTGASRGIGRACALALSAAGARVVLAARQLEKLEQVADEIRAAGGDPFVSAIDMSAPDSIRAAFAKAAKEFGRIDILVNNAAITKDGLAMRMKPQDWDSVLATNLTGAFLATQQVLLGMMRERWGRIINITSVVAEAGNAGQANYAASKAGLIGLTKSLAQEMASRNVTVNAVAPGFVDTDMTQSLAPEFKTRLLAAIPLQRLGRPEDVAAAVRFLASDDASYITGHVLNVNGGMYM
jgi:3-oxoacyl-[acyl-carrier protein] reductase